MYIISDSLVTGTHAIGEAFRNIKHGYSDVILAGGAEGSICEIRCRIRGINSLQAVKIQMELHLPFDKKRGGFVMGEGAGVLVLESLEHAQSVALKFIQKLLDMVLQEMLII